VKKLLSFCTRICWSASRTASWKGIRREAGRVLRTTGLLLPNADGGSGRRTVPRAGDPQPAVRSPYSYLSASIGSSAAALRAG
jgi:hypothetical protein